MRPRRSPKMLGNAVLAVLAVTTLLAAGCVWRTNEEQRQMSARSYVRPIGKTAGTTITLQGKRKYSFKIDTDRDEHGTRYGIEPDSYRVTVRRGDTVLVNRVLFIADGETRDVPVR